MTATLLIGKKRSTRMKNLPSNNSRHSAKSRKSVFGMRVATLPTEGESFEMNSDQFEGKWKQLKGTVKQRWGKLTDNDITTLSGKKDELVGKIQERYGITREQAEKEADEWASASAHEMKQEARSASKY